MGGSIVLLIIGLALTEAKIYEKCEFVKELYNKHHMNKQTIGYHVCIAAKRSEFDTRHGYINSEFLGIYKFGKKWWCGEQTAGGGCNIKCSNLLDDDITDDVKCATGILNTMGIGAWSIEPNSCIQYQNEVMDCLPHEEDKPNDCNARHIKYYIFMITEIQNLTVKVSNYVKQQQASKFSWNWFKSFFNFLTVL
ncbi:lysozyme c-1-like [Chironomus tepperi]|uniref:lysozyme c-1-like n=1 Tax=Chironomus tepperi TaxID=113505 RepID=UPI00391F64BE